MKAVEAVNLTKMYSDFKAVDSISFDVDEGQIFGLLGPNGAGKTTTIRMALTLIRPTSGSIKVFDIDCVKSAASVRQISGYVPQEVSIDTDLSGYENLLMYSKLYYTPKQERGKRIQDALEYMELADRQHDLAKTYSGGMMRRLEIAQALMNRPKMLLLDEPSIGLDPSAKTAVWSQVMHLRDEFGTTILVTTHDMREAEVLCDEIAIMNKGKIVVDGSPMQLKDDLGGDMISITAHDGDCSSILREHGQLLVSKPDEGTYELVVAQGEKAIPAVLESLETRKIHVESVSLKKSTLDDVFLKHAGARIQDGGTWRDARVTRTAMRKRKG